MPKNHWMPFGLVIELLLDDIALIIQERHQ